jgi:hypothetical protein
VEKRSEAILTASKMLNAANFSKMAKRFGAKLFKSNAGKM